MNVLAVVAHPDDEALGCGGTLARHVDQGDKVHILIVADGETARIMHQRGERNSDALRAAKLIGASVQFLDHPDQRLDQLALLDITREIEAVAKFWLPTVVYTHHANDLNQDHRIVHNAVLTAFRPLPASSCKEINCFEVPSSTEWGTGFEPNYFVDISKYKSRKLEMLNCYNSEMRPHPHARSYTAVIARGTFRGGTIGVDTAEAFMTVRRIR